MKLYNTMVYKCAAVALSVESMFRTVRYWCLLQVGCSVEVHKSDSTRYLEATLTRITDHSLYTVGMLQNFLIGTSAACAGFILYANSFNS